MKEPDRRVPKEALAECFLCGKPVLQGVHWFGLKDDLAPQAPCHVECVSGRWTPAVQMSYHRWVGDIFNAERARLGPYGRA